MEVANPGRCGGGGGGVSAKEKCPSCEERLELEHKRVNHSRIQHPHGYLGRKYMIISTSEVVEQGPE